MVSHNAGTGVTCMLPLFPPSLHTPMVVITLPWYSMEPWFSTILNKLTNQTSLNLVDPTKNRWLALEK